jgi:hypothetical protein
MYTPHPKYPSVTAILGHYTDFSCIKPEVLENAARRGQRVHAICASKLQGLWVPDVPEDCAGFVASFDSWSSGIVEELVACEVELIHPVFKYVGHPDMVVRLKGDSTLTVLDLKTPATKQKTWRYQIAAYKQLIESNDIGEVGRGMCLRLKKDGSSPIVDEYTSMAGDFQVFQAALIAHNYLA